MFSSRARYSSGVNDCLTAIKTFTIPKLEDRQMFVVIICDSWLSVIICDWCLSVVIIWDSWLLLLFVIGVCGHYLWFMIAVIIVNDVCGHYLRFMIVVIVYGWCLWSLFVIHYCCHYLWLMFVVIICDSWLLLFVTDVCGHCLWLMIVAIICDWCLWSLFVIHDCCQYFAHCGCCLVPRWRDGRNARYIRRWGLRFGWLCCWCCGAKSDVAKDLGDPRG